MENNSRLISKEELVSKIQRQLASLPVRDLYLIASKMQFQFPPLFDGNLMFQNGFVWLKSNKVKEAVDATGPEGD